jgi:hypothetical protein
MPLKQKVNPNPELTQSYLKTRVTYDPETGVFLWCNGYGGVTAGHPAGRKTTGLKDGSPYWRVTIDSREYKAHRLAWFYMTGEWPPNQVDHINGDPRDNRWANLRLATQTQNKRNSRIYKSNKSGVKGVSWDMANQKWVAVIQVNGKQVYLGRFADIRDAARAYRTAAEHYFGGFSRTS